MIGGVRWLVIVAVAACSSSSPCDLAVRPGSGSIPRVASSYSPAEEIVLSDGTLGVALCELIEVPPAGEQAHAVKLPNFVVGTGLTAGVSDDLYYSDTVGNLSHVSSDGSVLWSVPVDPSVYGTKLLPAPEGVYALYLPSPETVADAQTTAFDDTGAMRWQMRGRYYPDASGGVLGVDDVPSGVTTSSRQIVALDASLATRWTKTFAAQGATANVELAAPVVTTSGLVVVTGRLLGTSVELGDATVTAQNFVVALDRASGATRWTATIASPAAALLVAGDGVVVVRESATPVTLQGFDLDAIDASGQLTNRSVPFATQTNNVEIVGDVLGAWGGSVWIALYLLVEGDGSVDSYELEVADQRYSGPDAAYLLNIAL